MTTAVAVTTQADEIKGTLVKMSEAGQIPLPKHIQPERFVAVAQMAIISNPDLVKCDRNSLYAAVTHAAQDGLFPDGREAAIVPFGGKAKYMPMVAGICKKARNSGEVSAIDAVVVHENDEYDSWTDETGPHFKFKRVYKNRGGVRLTFAYAIMKDKTVMFEEIDEDQMAAIKKMSKANDSPWKGPFEDEMRRKSALRRLGKYRLPNSSDLDTLFKEDDDFYDDPDQNPGDKKEPKRPERLAGIVEADATVIDDKPAPSAQEAVAMAKKVFPASRQVGPQAAPAPAAAAPKPAPAPAAAKPAAKKAEPAPAPLIITGKLEKFTYKDLKMPDGDKRRYACRFIGAPTLWYGTFDEKVFEQMQAAIDAAADTTITYKERKEGENIFRDILAFKYVVVEGEAVSEEEVPI